MPHLRQYSGGHVQSGEELVAQWEKRPFPTTWEDFEAAVIEFVVMAWPNWSCPHCKHRFWNVLEPVKLESSVAWPIKEGSTYGTYPVVPVACTWCHQVTPILLLSIFDAPPAP